VLACFIGVQAFRVCLSKVDEFPATHLSLLVDAYISRDAVEPSGELPLVIVPFYMSEGAKEGFLGRFGRDIPVPEKLVAEIVNPGLETVYQLGKGIMVSSASLDCQIGIFPF